MRIDVTNGEKEYLVATVTEKTGADLSTATFQVGLGTNSEPPETWQAPDVEDVDGATATLKLLVDEVGQIGTWKFWVKVSDTPEVLLVKASSTQSVNVV